MNSTTSLSFYSSTFQILAGVYTASVIVLGIIFTFFGQYHLLFNIIDAILMIYFLFFTSVNYPVNVVDFSKLFGDFHYNFFPNPVKSILSSSTSLSHISSFKENKYSDIFLNNASLQLNLIIIALIIYLILKILIRSVEKMNILLSPHFNRAWEWEAFVFLIWIFSFQFTVFSILQIISFSFDTTIQAISSILAIAQILVSIVAPFYAFILINDGRFELFKPKKMRSFRISYLSLVRGLKINKEELTELEKIEIERKHEEKMMQLKQQRENEEMNEGEKKEEVQVVVLPPAEPIFYNPFEIIKNELQDDVYEIYSLSEQKQFQSSAKFANALVLARRFIFSLMIVFWYNSKYTQMAVICIMNIIIFIYYINKQPYIIKIDNYRNILHEVLFFLIQVAVGLFNDKTSSSTNNTDSNQVLLGWGFIIGSIIILLSSFIDLCYKLYRFIKRYPRYKQLLEENNQVFPLQQTQTIVKKEEMASDIKTQQTQPEVIHGEEIHQREAQIIEEKPILVQEQPLQKKIELQIVDPQLNNEENPTKDITKKTKMFHVLEVTGKQDATITQAPLSQPYPPNLNILDDQTQFQKSHSRIDIKAVKLRMKKICFKRNPFVSKEDEALLRIEKNNETKSTIGGQSSQEILFKLI